MTALLTHPSRFVRTGSSFTLVLACYWVYGIVAVPLIEPEAELRASVPTTPGERPVASPRRKSEIDALFAPEDWERRDPVMLENQRGKLLIGDYKNNPDGSVTISPCTIIMLPSGEFEDEAERIRQAVVLQAIDRAVLRFDEPFDIRRGSIGKLVSGTLMGPILIRSDQKQPGSQDDLWIETRDVQLSEESVTTDSAVKFRWGANHGSGRQMRMELLPASGTSKSRGPQVAGLKSMALFREVRLHLVPDEKQMQAALKRDAGKPQGPPSAPGGKRWKPLPVEVSCQGPFRFDLEKRVATFQDRVDVLQIQPNGPSDQLSGELLAIHFAPKDEPLSGAANPPSDQDQATSNDRLEPRRLELKGNPVIVRSPANAVHARGQRLEYDIPTRRVSLAGEPEVVVTRGGDEIRARELHYQPGEQNRIGKFLAIGPGWLRGVMPERSQPIEANWSRQLWVRPDPDSPSNDVVSLEGTANARAPGMGGLSAEEIYCWLIQRPVAAQASAGAAVEPKTETAPDRLLARGNVQIDSPQLIGGTEQLETWFEHPAPPPVAAGPPASTASFTPTPGPSSAPPPASTPPSQSGFASLAARPRGPADQRFDVSGKLMRIKLLMTGREAELAEVVIDGQARFTEIPAREAVPPQPPMLVEGDLLHVVQTSPQEASVTVTGKPAHVEAGGMGLRGAAINVSRGANRLWIDGEGRMTMQVDRDMEGRPLQKPQPLEVQWQGRMNFNGLTAAFERLVTARTQQQSLHTEFLEITLSRKIDFSQPKQAGERPDVAEVVCRGGAVLDSKTYDERGLASIEHLETADLSINRLTGAVLANAWPDRAGIIVQVRRGDNRAGLPIPGAPREAPPAAANDEGLSYLHVQFRRNLVGDINRREMTFSDKVKCVYGPVPTWDSVLTSDQPGERGILLTCDLMKVREMESALPDTRATELEALGNTSVEDGAETFRATSATMRYSSEKGMLTLVGDGRRDVEFSQRPPSGGSRNGTARRVEYWPEKRRLMVGGVTSGSAIEPAK